MKQNFNSIIDQDWDDIAIDNGEFVTTFGEYHARLFPSGYDGKDEYSVSRSYSNSLFFSDNLIETTDFENSQLVTGESSYTQDFNQDGGVDQTLTMTAYDYRDNILAQDSQSVNTSDTTATIEVSISLTEEKVDRIEIERDSTFTGDGAEYIVDFEQIHFETKLADISYSPEVNSAKGIQASVKPHYLLEEEYYLGGVIDVYVNDEPLFSGKINEINTHQNDDGYYTVSADPPGKLLKDENINTNTDTYITSDFMAKIVDSYNGIDEQHFNITGTSNESLTAITRLDSRSLSANDSTAVATYSNVGDDASSIDRIYIKVGDSGGTYPIEITTTISTNNSSYSETLTSGSTEPDITGDGDFGEWVYIEPDDSLDGEEYNLEFDLATQNTILYDWVAVTSSDLERKVDIEEASKSLDNERVQTSDVDVANGSDDQILDYSRYGGSDTAPISGGIPLEPLQTNFIKDFDGSPGSGSSGERSDVNYSGGKASYLGGGLVSEGDTVEFEFSVDYTIEELEVNLRRAVKIQNSGHDFAYMPGIDIVVDGQHYPFILEGPYSDNDIPISWLYASTISQNISDFTTVKLEVVDASTNFSNEPDYDGYDEYIIDCLSVSDSRFDYQYDNTTNTDNGYLDHPSPYSTIDPIYVDFKQIFLGEMVDSGNISLTTDTGEVNSVSLSFNNGDSYYTENNTDSIQQSNFGVQSTVTARLSFIGRSPSGARSQTPRLGYGKYDVEQYDLYVDTLDIEFLHGVSYSGNKLKVLSEIADNSNYFYRWEGNQMFVFKAGYRETNIDLKKEEIDSSISIDEAYSSCEVIGSGSVSSGIIESQNAPPYLDRHKEIRDPEIETQQDAKRRARSFLRKNGEIEYKANIRSLPTLAPLGEEIPGDMFNHGKNSYIKRVRYTKRSSDIELGKTKKLEDEIVKLDRDTSSTKIRDT